MSGYTHSGVKGKMDRIFKPSPGKILVSDKLGNAVESNKTVTNLLSELEEDSKIGNLSNLTTTDKTNLVSAINEINANSGSGETTVEHSMSLLTRQILPQKIGGNQHSRSYVEFYSETDYNKWLVNSIDSSISPVTLVSDTSTQPVEFFPIDKSQMTFEPYAMRAKIFLYDIEAAVQTYNPNASRHGSGPDPVELSSGISGESGFLLLAHWVGLDGVAIDNPSGFYFCLGYNEETDEPIFQVVQNGDVLQSVVTVNGVTATARVNLSNLNDEAMENLLNAINTVDAKLKDNTTDPNYSTLPEFEAYLKSKYRLTEAQL